MTYFLWGHFLRGDLSWESGRTHPKNRYVNLYYKREPYRFIGQQMPPVQTDRHPVTCILQLTTCKEAQNYFRAYFRLFNFGGKLLNNPKKIKPIFDSSFTSNYTLKIRKLFLYFQLILYITFYRGLETNSFCHELLGFYCKVSFNFQEIFMFIILFQLVYELKLKEMP